MRAISPTLSRVCTQAEFTSQHSLNTSKVRASATRNGNTRGHAAHLDSVAGVDHCEVFLQEEVLEGHVFDDIERFAIFGPGEAAV